MVYVVRKVGEGLSGYEYVSWAQTFEGAERVRSEKENPEEWVISKMPQIYGKRRVEPGVTEEDRAARRIRHARKQKIKDYYRKHVWTFPELDELDEGEES